MAPFGSNFAARSSRKRAFSRSASARAFAASALVNLGQGMLVFGLGLFQLSLRTIEFTHEWPLIDDKQHVAFLYQ